LKQLQESGVGEPYANAIALIESARVRGFAATDIPIGQVPTITVNPHTGSFASFLNGQFGKKEFETAIGGRRVFRLTGFPGPYGDTAFSYLVPIADDRMVELFAHRAYLDQAKTPTHYDQVIEHIISTLAVFAPSRQ